MKNKRSGELFKFECRKIISFQYDSHFWFPAPWKWQRILFTNLVFGMSLTRAFKLFTVAVNLVNILVMVSVSLILYSHICAQEVDLFFHLICTFMSHF